jgi:hypothetical protein
MYPILASRQRRPNVIGSVQGLEVVKEFTYIQTGAVVPSTVVLNGFLYVVIGLLLVNGLVTIMTVDVYCAGHIALKLLVHFCASI